MKLKLQFDSLLTGTLINVVYVLKQWMFYKQYNAIQGQDIFQTEHFVWSSSLYHTESY